MYRHDVQHHRYADDIQLYAQFDPSDASSVDDAIRRIQGCIDEVKAWMSSNSLKLNHDKTELLNIMSPHHLQNFGSHSITIDDVVIPPSKTVTSLGVVLDQHLSMTAQISSVVKACNFHLRNIGRIRQFISLDACKTAVQCLITSKMDYCCSLLNGVPQTEIERLQRVQNRAARVICRSKTSDHITPILQRLHWLPVALRIQFRVLTFVFKCFVNMAPRYIQSLLTVYRPTRNLRSLADSRLFSVPVTKKAVGRRAFSYAPSAWNSIPYVIRHSCSIDVFKKALKTYFFRSFYGGLAF